LKVVNTRSYAIRTQVGLGSKRLNGTGTVTILIGALTEVNSFDQPDQIAPVTTVVSGPRQPVCLRLRA
jgi:hypothetical protein